MAKQPTGIFDYVSPSGRTFLNKGRQYTSPTPGRTGATIDLSPLKGKTAAGGAPLASRQIPAAIQEAGPEAMSITDNIASTQPQMVTETQQPITQPAIDPRFMLQGGGPRIDLSGFFPERANTSYDPSKAIGGENVPYKPAGFFRGLMGDPANRKNIEAQLAQGAEWKQDARDQKIEERLLNRMREGDKPTQERFKITQAAAEKAEADRVAAENKRLELEGKRVGLTERQIEEARLDRIERLKGEQADRDARIEDMRTRNALADAAFGRSMLPTAQAISTGQGGVLMYDPRSGQPIGTFSSPTIGEITNPKTGEKTFGPTGGGYKAYTPPVKAPVNTGGGQVDRGTGATMGGPLPVDAGATSAPRVAPPRSGLMDMIGAGAENVAGALDLEGISQIPAALGDLLTRDPKEIQKAARSRARYMDPSMQRTF